VLMIDRGVLYRTSDGVGACDALHDRGTLEDSSVRFESSGAYIKVT
jgi:hypothetical protein